MRRLATHAQVPYRQSVSAVYSGTSKDTLDMALGGKVIYFVRLHTLDDTDERAGVCHVSIVQVNGTFLFHVAYPLIEVEVFDAAGVERGRATQDTVHFISFLQEEFGKERASCPVMPEIRAFFIMYASCYYVFSDCNIRYFPRDGKI